MEEVIICFMIFYVGSLMGCLLEEIWCMLTKHKFEIRGSMVYEPLIPIYGLAALLITLIANRVGYNLWKVFILGSIVSALIEYLSSYFQEKIFHTKAWDYSNYPLNLNGRINLPSSEDRFDNKDSLTAIGIKIRIWFFCSIIY